MGLKRISTLPYDPSYVPIMGPYRNTQVHSEIILDIAQSHRVMADKRNPKIDPESRDIWVVNGRTGLGA